MLKKAIIPYSIFSWFHRSLEKGIAEIEQERRDLAPVIESKRQEEAEYRDKYLKLAQVLRRAGEKVHEARRKLATLAKNVDRTPDITSFVSYSYL